MNFSLFKRLWCIYTRPYAKYFFLAMLFSLIVSGFTGLVAWMIEPALTKIFEDKNETMLYIIPFGIIGLFFLKGLFAFLQGCVMAYVAQNVITNIRNDVYKKIIYLPVSEFSRLSSGALSARVFYQVNILQRIVAGSIKNTVQQVFSIIALTFVLFYRDWRLAIIAVTVLPATGYLIKRLGQRTKNLVKKQNDIVENIFGFLNDTIGSPRIIKSFRAEEKEIDKFMGITHGIKTLLMKIARVRAMSPPLMEFIGSIAIAGVIVYGGNRVISGTTTAASLFSFIAALMMLYAPIKLLSKTSNTYHLAMVSAERIFEVLDMENEREEIFSTDKKQLQYIQDGISFNNVSFAYEKSKKNTLTGISFKVKPGESVAFVGSSGAGKTTIVNLLPRFYDVTEGSIRIDESDLSEYSLASLRDGISFVTQDVMLFNDTVKNNISYGKFDATDEEIIEAARSAYAHDFIMGMKNGYESVISERGSNISGGEKQRIAIARAILKNSPVLVLDEATSSLDSESERIVQKAFDNLKMNKTTFIIAHSLSTVKNVDRIFVVDKGRIAEEGSHLELMEGNGYYKKLFELQYNS